MFKKIVLGLSLFGILAFLPVAADAACVNEGWKNRCVSADTSDDHPQGQRENKG